MPRVSDPGQLDSEDEEEEGDEEEDEREKKKAKIEEDDEKKKAKNQKGVRRADGFVGPAGNVCKKEGRKKKKYEAKAQDRRTGKRPSVGYYATEAEARAALRVKQAELDATFEATDEAFKAGVAATEGLPASPDDIADAVPGKTYRHQAHRTNFVPYAAVVMRNGKQGLAWQVACAHVDPETGEKWTCGHQAQAAKKGEPARFCQSHGGKCPHGMKWGKCRECNPNAAKGAYNCGACAKIMDFKSKRLISKGGSGYCVDCQPHIDAQAKAAGADPLPKNKKTEDVCFDVIEPLIVDENDWVISAELRDNHKLMLGAINKNGKRTRGVGGDCDTTTVRRPDRLWVVRNEDARIVAVLSLECDEDSHGPRKSKCEAGKVDDSFASLCKFAQDEGKGRLADFSKEHEYMPYFLTIKFNPDACDTRLANGEVIPRQHRLEVVAALARDFLNKPASHYEALSAKGEAMVPHVRALYYYSKSKHLKYFDEKQHGAWDWQGNACPL